LSEKKKEKIFKKMFHKGKKINHRNNDKKKRKNKNKNNKSKNKNKKGLTGIQSRWGLVGNHDHGEHGPNRVEGRLSVSHLNASDTKRPHISPSVISGVHVQN